MIKLIIFTNSFRNNKIYPNTDNNLIINKVAHDKYFSFLIHEKYGGIKLSVNELSNLLLIKVSLC